MVKLQVKLLQSEKTPINHASNTPKEYNSPKKSRQQIYQENYQKNKEKKKQQQKERYYRQKELEQNQQKEVLSKYYEAEAIRILMSFKEYTELNKEKRQLWVDFNWTLNDCKKAFSEGFGNEVAVMKLAQVADKLVRDFWKTAKAEKRRKVKSWNSLDYDEKQKLIRYWGYEKARVENSYIDTEERLERQSNDYLKEIERAKFHEERGKINCDCSQCQFEREIHNEVKAKIKKEKKAAAKWWADYHQENEKSEAEYIRADCANCYEEKRVSVESGLCRKCEREAEEGYGEDE
jgi:hypothetical protein